MKFSTLKEYVESERYTATIFYGDKATPQATKFKLAKIENTGRLSPIDPQHPVKTTKQIITRSNEGIRKYNRLNDFLLSGKTQYGFAELYFEDYDPDSLAFSTPHDCKGIEHVIECKITIIKQHKFL